MGADVYDVIIIGGGLSGLAAAYGLRDRRVLLCEKAETLGGRIRTRLRGGLACDLGAVLAYQTDYLPFKPSGHRLFREDGPIGLSWGGKVHRGGTVAACLEAALRDDPEEYEEILRFERGEIPFETLRERSRILLNAFFQGIHPGEIRDYLPARRKDAFERYDPGHYHDGNYGLIEEFRSRVTAELRLSAEVRSIEREGAVFRLVLRAGGRKTVVRSKTVIAAVTASAAKNLLPGLSGAASGFLGSVRYGSFVTAALGTEADLGKDFSYLVTPGRAATTIYKMTFPGTGPRVLLFFFCDKAAKAARDRSDAEMIELSVREAAAAGLALTREDVLFGDVARWEEGGTIISTEYYAKWSPEAANPAEGIFLAGDYLYRDFPYGMEAAVRSGGAAADAADAYLAAEDDPEGRVISLAAKASERPLPMTCRPPYPEAPYAYGDLVPLGFLLRALRAVPGNETRLRLAAALEDLLRSRKQGPLWAFHTDRLVTATDSSLVLLGLRDEAAVEALDAFYDGTAGYYPQLWSETPDPGRMELAFNNRHWCRADFATTCLVRHERRQAGLPGKTPFRFLEDGFEKRGGLFFANPFLADWALALALGKDGEERRLGERLAAELLAAQEADGGFGRWDRVLSTAFAVLTLAELGLRGGALGRAVSALNYLRRENRGAAVPFYSADRVDLDSYPEAARFVVLIGNGDRIVNYGGKQYAVTLYEDSYGVITASAAFLARRAGEASGASDGLGEPGRVSAAGAARHLRYACETAEDYIARFALPPYLAGDGLETIAKDEKAGI